MKNVSFMLWRKSYGLFGQPSTFEKPNRPVASQSGPAAGRRPGCRPGRMKGRRAGLRCSPLVFHYFIFSSLHCFPTESQISERSSPAQRAFKCLLNPCTFFPRYHLRLGPRPAPGLDYRVCFLTGLWHPLRLGSKAASIRPNAHPGLSRLGSLHPAPPDGAGAARINSFQTQHRSRKLP